MDVDRSGIGFVGMVRGRFGMAVVFASGREFVRKQCQSLDPSRPLDLHGVVARRGEDGWTTLADGPVAGDMAWAGTWILPCWCARKT